ncbi:Transposase [Moritella sp. JT01]|nr:Transposase [Moritella sp. JT01]
MSKHNIVFIGMDTHKSFIEVAYIEDVRDLSRDRDTAMKDLKEGKYQLKALLLRNNVTAKMKDNWSKQQVFLQNSWI